MTGENIDITKERQIKEEQLSDTITEQQNIRESLSDVLYSFRKTQQEIEGYREQYVVEAFENRKETEEDQAFFQQVSSKVVMLQEEIEEEFVKQKTELMDEIEPLQIEKQGEKGNGN